MRRSGLVVGEKWREQTVKIVLFDGCEGLFTEQEGALKLCVWFHGENKQVLDLMGKKFLESIRANTICKYRHPIISKIKKGSRVNYGNMLRKA